MEAYRDQYATLFSNGRKVTVIGISVDADTTLADWAREVGFPDRIRERQGEQASSASATPCTIPLNKLDNRSLFVVGPDGRIAYVTQSFKVLSPAAYADLRQAVEKVTPTSSDSTPCPAAEEVAERRSAGGGDPPRLRTATALS